MRNFSEIPANAKEAPIPDEETGRGNISVEVFNIKTVATRTQPDFVKNLKTFIKGYTDTQEQTFKPEDYAKFNSDKEQRLERVKNFLISLAPVLKEEIEEYLTGIHAESLRVMKEVHHEFLASQITKGETIESSILAGYPDLQRKATAASAKAERKDKVNREIVAKLSANFDRIAAQHMFAPENLKTELENLLNANVEVKKWYCIITEPNSDIEYIAAYPNNRPANIDVVDLFQLKTEMSVSGMANNNVRSLKKPAVVTRIGEDKEFVAIEKGELEVW